MYTMCYNVTMQVYRDEERLTEHKGLVPRQYNKWSLLTNIQVEPTHITLNPKLDLSVTNQFDASFRMRFLVSKGVVKSLHQGETDGLS